MIYPLLRLELPSITNLFLPSTISEWNSLPLHLRDAPTLESFKQKLNAGKIRKPKYFYSGTRQLQIMHCRLRTKCSPLNQHIYRKHIVDCPKCLCGLTESTNHYFFLNVNVILVGITNDSAHNDSA